MIIIFSVFEVVVDEGVVPNVLIAMIIDIRVPIFIFVF